MHPASLILSLAFAANPISAELPTERVDLIESNHYFDENGVHLLDQAIFFRWCDREDRYQVAAWRLIKTPANAPRPCSEGWEMTWNENGVTRRVVANQHRESWTQFDPELTERKHLPPDQREGIFNEKRPLPESDPLPPAPEGMR